MEIALEEVAGVGAPAEVPPGDHSHITVAHSFVIATCYTTSKVASSSRGFRVGLSFVWGAPRLVVRFFMYRDFE